MDNKLDTMFRGGKVDNYFKVHMAFSFIVWLAMLGVPYLLRRKLKEGGLQLSTHINTTASTVATVCMLTLHQAGLAAWVKSHHRDPCWHHDFLDGCVHHGRSLFCNALKDDGSL